MLANLVKVSVPAPGTVDVGTVVALGAPDTGFVSFHARFGVGAPAYFALSDGAGRTIFGTWLTGTGTGGAPVATVTAILWNVRANAGGVAEGFTGACTAWNALPAEVTPDKAYADALPVVRSSVRREVWGGTADLVSGSDTSFIAFAVPVATRRILLTGGARAQNTSGTAASASFRAQLRNSAGQTILDPGEIGNLTSVGGAYASTGIAYAAEVDALPAGCALHVLARKDQAVGPFNLYNLWAAAQFVW